MHLNHLFVIGIVAYFATALTYIFSLLVHPLPYEYIFKTAPDMIAAIMVFAYAAPQGKGLLAGAFLACGLGDMLLGIDRTLYFMPALVSYLAGHIAFSLTFWRELQMSKAGLVRFSGVLIYTIAIGAYLLPQAGTFMLPVLVYLLAISGMAAVAGFRYGPHMTTVFIGSCLFLVGDSLIAVDKFAVTLPHTLPIIVSIYYSAIFCIVRGFIKEPGSFECQVS